MEVKEDWAGDYPQHRNSDIEATKSEALALVRVGEEEEQGKIADFQSKRVASLDIFRGLTVALMILVDDAGGEWPAIAHAPWNGCNLADFVMPFFLFIVGISIVLAFKSIQDRAMARKKVIVRTLQLLFWGLLLQGGFSHAPDKLTYGVDMKRIRWCGILQRIALAYLVVAFVEIFTKSSARNGPFPGRFSIFKLHIWHWMLGVCILIVYLGTLYGVYVPDWQFKVQDLRSPNYGKVLAVPCNVRGMLDPPCNAVGYVDRKVLGMSHMYQNPAWRRSRACNVNGHHEGPIRADAPSWCWAPFEPEGILSSVSAILSTIIGVHFGHVLISVRGHSSRLQHWTIMGLGLLIVGIVPHFTHAIPLNKQLYTLSYVCVTSGAAALVFSGFYVLGVILQIVLVIIWLFAKTEVHLGNMNHSYLLCKQDTHADSDFSDLVDMWKCRYLFLPLQWIGMNAMLVYVMAAEGIFAGFINGWYYDDPGNTLVHWIKQHIFIEVWHSTKVGTLLYVIFAEILFWGVVAGVLHRFSIYWKL